MGLERMSHTLLSMLNDYNTPLQRKALFPSWSEYSACEPGPDLTFFQHTAATKKRPLKNQTQGVGAASWGGTSELSHHLCFALTFQTLPLSPPFCSLSSVRQAGNTSSLSIVTWTVAILLRARVTTPFRGGKTICIWLQIKHAVSLAQSAIE